MRPVYWGRREIRMLFAWGAFWGTVQAFYLGRADVLWLALGFLVVAAALSWRRELRAPPLSQCCCWYRDRGGLAGGCRLCE